MSSNPPTYQGHETPNPYPPISALAPESPQPVGFINPRQVAPVFVTPPGVFPSSHLGPGNVQVTNPTPGTAAVPYQEAMKILGGIQIMIGLMHPGFGIILALLSYSLTEAWGFGSISFIAGYPFWGGLCLKGSLGTNILSCIFSIIGVVLLIVDLFINAHHQQVYWALVGGKGISAMLLLFSILEFGIACATAHFCTQAINNPSRSVLIIPNVHATNPMMHESASAPPTSDSQPPYAPRY
ncbi:membrane-spanning 4-domains subfamily A member 12 isoform X2 [Octodon degus]|uniref:Membrane-spanning 4-domains subfamily A member 12 isoform X2 n=1 Tax=Octodon degus TaxID=10160 RepID=A0A6P6DS41_OCTDE|nr:membrane-spanning 4-domains subfamily A member 12 isoform X2 [Octodon degus]